MRVCRSDNPDLMVGDVAGTDVSNFEVSGLSASVFHTSNERDSHVAGSVGWLDGVLGDASVAGIVSDSPWDNLHDVSLPKKNVSKIRLCNNFRVRGVCVGMCFKNLCGYAHDLWDLDVGLCHRNGDNDVYMHSKLTDYKERINVFLAYYERDPECDKIYFQILLFWEGIYLVWLINLLYLIGLCIMLCMLICRLDDVTRWCISEVSSYHLLLSLVCFA